MTNTINNAIPFAPENTIDPAAGLNLALNTVDALLQLAVVSVGLNTPPAGVAGERYVVGTAPTGLWAGKANQVARFLDGAWTFYAARTALNIADGAVWVRTGATWAASGGDKQPADATLTALAGLATGANKLPYSTGVDVFAQTDLTAFARTLLEDADAAAARATLELGSAATRAALGTTGALYSRDSILGTVSQAAGVPTGAIIQRGSNANGEFVRFADGTQICTRGGSGWVGSDLDNYYAHAAAFISVPAVTWNTVPSTNVYAVSAVWSQGTAWSFRHTTASPQSFYLVAIGRWYQ
jgi:hypothetical protein